MKMIAGSCLRAIGEQAPDAGGPEAREHLDEGGRRLGEELRRRTRGRRPWPAASCRSPAVRAAGSPSAPSRPAPWKAFGSRRNSTISLSSAFASSTPAMSSKLTPCLEAGLMRCGLMRGITFSVRHITRMMAVKKRIAMTGSQLVGEVLDFLNERGVRPRAARVACTTAGMCRHGMCRRGVPGMPGDGMPAARLIVPRHARWPCASPSTTADAGVVVPASCSPSLHLPRPHHPWHRHSIMRVRLPRCRAGGELSPGCRVARSLKSSVANARSRTSMRSSAPCTSGAASQQRLVAVGKEPVGDAFREGVAEVTRVGEARQHDGHRLGARIALGDPGRDRVHQLAAHRRAVAHHPLGEVQPPAPFLARAPPRPPPGPPPRRGRAARGSRPSARLGSGSR